MSGLSHTPGKRAWVHSPPRVRIPPSPPGQKKNRSAQRSAVFSFVESPASWSVAGSRTYLYALASKPAVYENAVDDCVFIRTQIASTEVVSSASNATTSPLGFPNSAQSPPARNFERGGGIHGELPLGAALAGKRHLQFRNVRLALFFRNLLQISAADESAHLDELPDEIVLPRLKHQLQCVRRKFRFGFDLVCLPALDLRIEKHIRRVR